MTMQENGNLAEIFVKMGIKEELADFFLGIEGFISTDEAAQRIMEAMKTKLKKEQEI